MNTLGGHHVPAQPPVGVPATLAQALDPAWLTPALADISGRRRVTCVETIEVLRTVATKVRFTVAFKDDDAKHHFCLKGLLDADEGAARAGPTCVHEGDFYARLAGRLGVRVPECLVVIADREAMQGIIIMRDLIADGARFCSALEPLSADDAAQSLEQIARLHAGRTLLDGAPWVTPRAASLVGMPMMNERVLQDLLDGPRGDNLSPFVRNGSRLYAAMRTFADRDLSRPHFLVHGDAHAGNLFRNREGLGIIDWQLLQRGGWAIDVAYHLCAVLPVELAAREERGLLRHYLGTMRAAGHEMPDDDEAWRQYGEALTYGFFLWALTRRVDPAITHKFVDRLGQAVMRHESFKLLGIS